MSISQKRKAKGSCHTGLNTHKEIGERQLPLRPSPCPTQPLFTHFPHQCGTCTSQRVLPTPPTGLLMPGGAEAAYLVPVGDLAGASPVPHSLSLHPLGLTADEPLGSPVVKLYSSLPKELMWPHSSFRENLPPPRRPIEHQGPEQSCHISVAAKSKIGSWSPPRASAGLARGWCLGLQALQRHPEKSLLLRTVGRQQGKSRPHSPDCFTVLLRGPTVYTGLDRQLCRSVGNQLDA